jgi:hypothetical protein
LPGVEATPQQIGKGIAAAAALGAAAHLVSFGAKQALSRDDEPRSTSSAPRS